MTKTHHKTVKKYIPNSNRIHIIKQDGIASQATRLNPSPNSKFQQANKPNREKNHGPIIMHNQQWNKLTIQYPGTFKGNNSYRRTFFIYFQGITRRFISSEEPKNSYSVLENKK